jgi:hypothetical protein
MELLIALIVFCLAACVLARGTSARFALAVLVTTIACSAMATTAVADELPWTCLSQRQPPALTSIKLSEFQAFQGLARRSTPAPAQAPCVDSKSTPTTKPLAHVSTPPVVAKAERWEYRRVCVNGRCSTQLVRVAD